MESLSRNASLPSEEKHLNEIKSRKNYFEPVTVTKIPDNSSTFNLLRTMFRSPVEMWPEKLYREYTHEMRIFGKRYICVTNPEIIKDILLTHYTIFPRSEILNAILKRAGGQGILTIYGSRWKTQRKALAPAFRPAQFNTLLPGIIQIGKQTASSLSRNSGKVSIAEEMDKVFLEIFVQMMLSDEVSNLDAQTISNDIELFLKYSGRFDVFDLFQSTRSLPKPWKRKGQRAVKRLRKRAMEIIERRRKSEETCDDLLSMLINAKDTDSGEGLTDAEIRDNVITFFSAGHDTLSLTLSWALYLLANCQEWQDRLLEEVQRICGDGPLKPEHIANLKDHELVIKETMRLFPPVYSIERVALESMTFSDGTSVEPGDTVLIATYALHRHEKLWRNPNNFDPEQFKPENAGDHHRFQYVPFGGGPRVCIATGLSMIEAVAILASIIKMNKVTPIEGLTPYPKSRILLWPEGGINLNVSPRH